MISGMPPYAQIRMYSSEVEDMMYAKLTGWELLEVSATARRPPPFVAAGS